MITVLKKEEESEWQSVPNRRTSTGKRSFANHLCVHTRGDEGCHPLLQYVITPRPLCSDGGGGPPPSGGDNSTGAAGGAPQGPMRDPSKPPGPNPKWGYWEWDGESGQWELEDFRRKRRQAAGAVLAGRYAAGMLQT